MANRDPSKQAGHEDYTIKAITQSSLTKCFDQLKQKVGLRPDCVAELIIGQTNNPSYFSVEGINYFPLLHQLVFGGNGLRPHGLSPQGQLLLWGELTESLTLTGLLITFPLV